MFSKVAQRASRCLWNNGFRNIGVHNEHRILQLLWTPLNQYSTNDNNSYGSREETRKSRWYHYTIGMGLVCAAISATTDEPLISRRLRLNAAEPAGLNLRGKFNFIADVVEKVSPAVVFINNSTYWRQGCGSGFIVSSDGLIVTNAHVVQSAKHGKVKVQLLNGRTYTGEVQVVDPTSDLALIKINDNDLPTIKLGISGTLRPGEWVVAVGSPLSLSNTVTSGIVSSTGRPSSELGLPNDIDYIQTDAPITFGNSGGPLINLDGEAVGVNSMKVTEGISFAIPSDYVQKFLLRAGDFKQEKQLQRQSRPPYVGLVTITLSPNVTAQLRNRADITDLDVDRGVFVVEVNAGSPAERAGIQKHDVIIKVDNKVIGDHHDLISTIREKSTAKFTIYRKGSVKEMHVRPETIS